MLRQLILAILLAAACCQRIAGQQVNTVFFETATTFFGKHVKDGLVDYRSIRSDSLLADSLLHLTARFNLNDAGKRMRKAFYINAYNFLVLKSIADRYPVTSPLQLPGFFDEDRHMVAGAAFTLDQLEYKITQVDYDDPRVAFWLSRGTRGGPPVSDVALTPANLDRNLDARMKALFNDPAYLVVDKERRELNVPLELSHGADTARLSDRVVLNLINRYRKKPLPDGYAVNYYAYNWSLNDLDVRDSVPPVLATPNRPESGAAEPATTDGEGSLPENDRLPADYARDHIISEATNMLNTPFQVRVVTNLLTQHASYNADWDRVNFKYRYTAFNMSFQFWSRVSGRFNFGVQFLTRTLQLSGFHDSPYRAITFSNDTNTAFFLRHVMNSARYLVYDKHFRIVAQSSFLVPVSRRILVRFDNNKQGDAGLAQWTNELLFARDYSRHFALYAGLTSVSRFGADDPEKRFDVRASLAPEFSYWFGRTVRLFAYLDLNTQVNHGFFSSFYVREGTGLSLRPAAAWQFDIQFSYDAVGKKSGAFSSFTFSSRFNL